MSYEIENRLRLLEENYEYQDQMVETLNEVIIKQQVQLDKLQEEIKNLTEKIASISETEKQEKDPLPPHY